jgi:hypothetical protein
MLAQIAYMSDRNSDCTQTEIKDILSSCKKNNPTLEITGVLLYSDSKFIQMVEGESKTIIGLYDKIKLDSRHHNVRMISYRSIKEKSFPSWHMGARKIVGSLVDFETDISEEEKTVFNNILNGKEENGAKVLDLLIKLF